MGGKDNLPERRAILDVFGQSLGNPSITNLVSVKDENLRRIGACLNLSNGLLD